MVVMLDAFFGIVLTWNNFFFPDFCFPRVLLCRIFFFVYSCFPLKSLLCRHQNSGEVNKRIRKVQGT
jgi:hypothetical protein